MTIYVVIVTYNGAPWIRGVLGSLRNSERKCTPVVVDNASEDGTPDIIRREFPEAILLPQEHNGGFGRGNNVGISFAMAQGASYIFLLNQDAYVTPSALGQLADFLDQHPEYAVATPLHCSPDLNSLDPQTQRGYLQRHAPRYLSDACLGQSKEYYDIRGINAAAWMVRAEAFQVVGGFDPIFFMYGEDDDLIARFAYLGQRFALLPASRIVHLRARSPRPPVRLLRQIWNISERARSEMMVDMKNPEGKWTAKLLRLLAAGIVLPIARVLGNYDWKEVCAYFVATLRVLSECPTIFRRARQCGTRGSHFLDI
jgi:GT2 family glycosyltransferase